MNLQLKNVSMQACFVKWGLTGDYSGLNLGCWGSELRLPPWLTVSFFWHTHSKCEVGTSHLKRIENPGLFFISSEQTSH